MDVEHSELSECQCKPACWGTTVVGQKVKGMGCALCCCCACCAYRACLRGIDVCPAQHMLYRCHCIQLQALQVGSESAAVQNMFNCPITLG